MVPLTTHLHRNTFIIHTLKPSFGPECVILSFSRCVFSSALFPPVQPSHSLPLLLFPEVLRSLCCCVITADALGALFSSFPSLCVSATHHASLCPPNAPLSLPQSILGNRP